MPYIVRKEQNAHAKKNKKNFNSPLASATEIWYTVGALRDKGSFKAVNKDNDIERTKR